MTLLVRTFRIVPQARIGVIQRLGTYNRSAESGLVVVLPFIDTMLPLIDMREQVVSFAPQPVITSDNVTINVTSVVYYQILDAKAASYQVANLLQAMEQIAQTTLRNVMGSLSLDTSLTSRDEINARLRVVLDEVTERWGVRVNRVELKDISPPKDIQLAMEKQMQAERNKRATVLTAEGEAQAAVLRAEGAQKALILSSEGQRQASILRAEGDAQALITLQEAQATSVRMVMDAVNASGAPAEAMQLQYMQMLPKLAANPANKVIVVPADMAGLAGLATSISQIAQSDQATPTRQLTDGVPSTGNGLNGARTQLTAADAT
ncbi:MAG TPA: SPFH domain-containing protein [Chloroflexota bacterium]|jgi:regulator of protease activity HflC (stomatin/prohibitin superfamily)|nr:SPFH domain-containing protein [Chloroflexota bacterium]